MADFARGELLRDLRERRHLSQEDAAHEIGVSTKTIRAWEKGGGIHWDNAKAAGTFYGVDPERLVSREEADETPVVELPQSQLDRIETYLRRLLAAQGLDPDAAPEDVAVQAAEEALQATRRARRGSARRQAAS